MNLKQFEEALGDFLDECQSAVYEKGILYFQQDRVRPEPEEIQAFFLKSTDSIICESAFEVRGTYLYRVTARFEKSDDQLHAELECACPANKPCKHMVAVSLYSLYCLFDLQNQVVHSNVQEQGPPYFQIVATESSQRLSIFPVNPRETNIERFLLIPEIREALSEYTLATEPYSSLELAIAVLISCPPEFYQITGEGLQTLTLSKAIKPEVSITLEEDYGSYHRNMQFVISSYRSVRNYSRSLYFNFMCLDHVPVYRSVCVHRVRALYR